MLVFYGFISAFVATVIAAIMQDVFGLEPPYPILSAPVAFFQGAEDRIVPPSQTEVMVSALRARGVPTLYLLFDGEQHGFRQAVNIERALEAEAAFFQAEAFGKNAG